MDKGDNENIQIICERKQVLDNNVIKTRGISINLTNA